MKRLRVPAAVLALAVLAACSAGDVTAPSLKGAGTPSFAGGNMLGSGNVDAPPSEEGSVGLADGTTTASDSTGTGDDPGRGGGMLGSGN
ncbi:MAG TPA: hypothetical protein VFQ45_14030 [Longimicrobium sp.]|nr:hypothetical protein [Longimicrobium sp.]